jgi:hypothetical protein
MFHYTLDAKLFLQPQQVHLSEHILSQLQKLYLRRERVRHREGKTR